MDLAAITADGEPAEFYMSRSHQQYLDDIQSIKDYLTEGETYEVCLTNKVRTDLAPDPLPLYRTLRSINPAPFSSYLRFGDATVLSSSPERFLERRARPLGRGQADQGHLPARRGPGRGPAPGRGAAHRREEPAPRT